MKAFASVVHRFWVDDSAQDLVEYSYLAVFVGLVGILVWGSILQLLGFRYTDYNTNVQGLWESPAAGS
jgi:Flp pilus assembly pilin Flp